MYKHILSVTILLLSIILLTVISALFIFESIEINRHKEQSSIAFANLENSLSSSSISQFSSQMRNYYFRMPTLKTLQIKNDQNLPIYFFADSKIDLKTIHNDFASRFSSIYNIVYANEVTLDNSKYNLEAVFTILTKSRLFNLLMKISVIFFIYLVLLICILIYIYSDRANSNKNYLTTTNSDPGSGLVSDSDYHDPAQKITDELKKSAAFDQDLVLTLIGSPEKLIFNNASEFEEILNRHFPFHDLIFRYEDNIFGILLPNTDLEQGIHQIELFDQTFVSSSTKSLKFPIMFGLSSRNGRLISGNIILKEAKAALKKAMNDNGFPIVGFRPNPARYREYLSKLKTKS